MKACVQWARWFLLLLILEVNLAVGQPSAAKEPAKGLCVLLTVEGKVEVSRAGATDWAPAQTNQVLQIGDRVRTSARSRATIRWSDRSERRVNELTTFTVAPPQRAGASPTLELQNGSAYSFSREGPTETRFRTPLASGAIRGTEFNLAVAENGRTVVSLLDGEIELTNQLGQVVLQSGEQGLVEPGQAPAKTAMIDAINVIQWSLYYPAVLDADEVGLSDTEKQALSESLAAYRSGDLLRALSAYPENRQPVSPAEGIYRAATLLAVGQVEQAETVLRPIQSPLADGLRELIAAVKNQPWTRPAPPTLATEWMAESYYLQSRLQLDAALNAAREATKKSAPFGYAWVRLAELEFSYGHNSKALDALDTGLWLSPRNAQGLALKGFILAGQNKIKEAITYFDQAIAIDGALGNAWLGRGLCKIRRGHTDEGRKDLQTAATLESQRSLLRSYLGKAWTYTKYDAIAEKELNRARQLDPKDPTPWLYAALLEQQQNRINAAVRDLEMSQTLNTNRSLFRSRFLLDQDQAVRSANLATIYRDAGMFDVSVREASRAVNYDYGNYSAHLFLAGSYDTLRDPKLINLRYEAPYFSEYLVGNLLAPVGGGNLSQNLSQQEYSKLFARDGVGISSSTEYFSNGDWIQSGSQYGTFGNTSYALDPYYRSENGQRPNNDLKQSAFSAKIKQQITPHDSVYLEAAYANIKSGDVAQYYDQASADPTLRVRELQEPNVFAGFHHEWQPGVHTLFLFGRLDDTLSLNSSAPRIPFVVYSRGQITDVRNPSGFTLDFRRELDAYSSELQQIWQTPKHALIVGGRYQTGETDTRSQLTRQLQGVVTDQDIEADLDRVSLYAYHHWQVFEPLRLIGGISYDYLNFPENADTSPISRKQNSQNQVSPKFGFIWTPLERTHVRGAYTRSLGGVFYDTSVRLEPVQIAGFSQAYRSLLPESAVGLVPGTSFDTYSLGFDHTFKTKTYFGIEGEILKSDGTRTVGVLTNSTGIPVPDSASSTRQNLDFTEKSLTVTLNQLLSEEWSLGTRYKLTHGDFDGRFTDIPSSVADARALNRNEQSTLHQLSLNALYHHRCGFFAQVQGLWTSQHNSGFVPKEPGDDFWQLNAFVGYRFWHRAAEATIGVLNITDQNYRLEPLTLYSELPRERTFYARLKFYF